MSRDVHDALASAFDQFDVHEQLHDVPPHAVYAVTVDGRRAVCKCDRHPEGRAAAEVGVLDAVAAETSLPVPSVLASGDDYFVAEWLDGIPDENETPAPDDVSPAYAWALGATMAHLHEETVGLSERTGLLSDERIADPGTLSLVDGGDETWHDTVLRFLRRRRDYLAARLDDDRYAEAADAAIRALEGHPALCRSVERPVVCHGNLLPDHVGFERGATGDPNAAAAVIDFEHALVGPPAFDVWRTALPVFLRPGDAADRPTLVDFETGYESVRPFPEFSRNRCVYPLVNTVSYLRSMHLQNRGFGSDERRRAEQMVEWIRETVAGLNEGDH